jgi:hypothetical protein
MFAHSAFMNLKPTTGTEFLKTVGTGIVPLLRKQIGFQDQMTLSDSCGRGVVAVSFWDQQENMQAYHSSGYPEVLKFLGKFLDGTPHVRTFEVVSSTLRNAAARAAA